MISLEAASSARDKIKRMEEYFDQEYPRQSPKDKKSRSRIIDLNCLCGGKVSASQRRQIVKKPADLSSWDKKKIIRIIAFKLRLASSTQSSVLYNGKGLLWLWCC